MSNTLIDTWNLREVTYEEALQKHLYCDPYYGGSLEQLQSKVEKLEALLFRIVIDHYNTPEKFNHLIGYKQYE